MNRFPDIITRKGIGTFSLTELEFEASFDIIHYPQKTVIETIIPDKYLQLMSFGLYDGSWTLDGVMEDDFKVFAENLTIINLNGNRLTLFSYKDLCFSHNQISDFSHAEFPLVGIYCPKFNFEKNGWEVSCYGLKDELELIEEKSRNWNIQLEGNILKLKKTNTTKDQYLTKANSIASLLSLALGNDVVFNRQLYYKDEKLLLEYWRRQVDYHFGAERCIPDSELNNFIKSSIDHFERWNERKRKLFLSTVTYINSSSKGYLENRLLGICIAWEGLAQSWTETRFKKSVNDLDRLKDFLKRSINDFELPAHCDKVFIKNRILESLDWEKLYESLKSFTDQFSLDDQKLGLDFKSLIKIRNDIAHTGLFQKDYSQLSLSGILYNHKFGLQVILLIELGYERLIVTQKENWATCIKIGEFLKSDP